MAFQSIDRNSGLFPKQKTDTINGMISEIDNKIDNLEVPDLEYKFPVKKDIYFTFNCLNNSFSVGQLKIISLEIKLDSIEKGVKYLGNGPDTTKPITIRGVDRKGRTYTLIINKMKTYIASNFSSTDNTDVYFYGIYL